MPIINVQMLSGRTTEQKSAFMKEVASAAMRTLQAPEHAIVIIINEVERDKWSVGLRTMTEIQARVAT
jgi:4-oxalocrotonate tautomerase